jgi:hypothetical protein
MTPNKNTGANIRAEAIPQSDSNPAIEDIAFIGFSSDYPLDALPI